jgi:hypothetical protein
MHHDKPSSPATLGGMETWRRRQFREIGMKHSTLISTRGYSTLTLFPPAVYPSPFTVLPYFYSCVHAPCLRPSIFSKSRVDTTVLCKSDLITGWNTYVFQNVIYGRVVGARAQTDRSGRSAAGAGTYGSPDFASLFNWGSES